jgi:polysaccharide export outer membrane protein
VALRKFVFYVGVSGLVMAQVACSSLPAQGPSAGKVLDAPTRSPSAEHAGYIVADLNPQVNTILASRGSNSFVARFGDYRPPENRVIGVGDSLSVTIWEAASGGLFSSPVVDRASPGSHTAVIPDQMVERDGAISVPYAGRIHVAGLTPPKVEQQIVKALEGKAIEPQALVSITKNLANTVTVSGEVAAGARVPLSPRGDRILDVVATAGGIKAPVHDVFITLTRDGHSVSVPMQTLLTRPSENIYVRAGDTLTLVADPQTFTVFGAAGKNALISFDAKGITLEEAVAKAGGLIDMQSDPEGVFLMRAEPIALARQLDPSFAFQPGQTMVNVIYRINLRDPNTYFLARNFPVQNKDIVYVASAFANELQKFLALVDNVATPIYTAKTVGAF